MFADSLAEVNWELTLGNLEKIVTILAILVGGLWAYYKFIKGRLFKSRLEIKVSGSLRCQDNMTYLVATAQLKNVGLTNVRIRQRGTALQIFVPANGADVAKAQAAEWTYLGILSVFEDHKWIESGEPVEEQHLYVIPGCDQKAFLLTLRVVPEGGWLVRIGDVLYEKLKDRVSESALKRLPARTTWKARAIVTWPPASTEAGNRHSEAKRDKRDRFWSLFSRNRPYD